ncbi:MAG TPA: two-component sensor histidine kinase [Clostridiales bacterium]|nr:two-component sensor histidine kinase [Clostridiales bacterium]
MKRDIFKRFILILSLVLIINSLIFAVLISNIIFDKTSNELLYTLKIADNSLDYEGNLKEQIDKIKSLDDDESTRLTLLDLNGNVIADSNVDDHKIMENHIAREEIIESLRDGHGSARRKSETLGSSMIYVASIAMNSDYILRIAVSYNGLFHYSETIFPTIVFNILVSLGISLLLTKQFLKSVTKPLVEIAGELRKIQDENPEFHFREYNYEEMNIIADTILEMSKAVKDSMKQIEFEKKIRQEFFSNASHELKTPITSVNGYIELIENDLVTNEAQKKDFLKRIKKETTNMTNLINDILLISRLETKEIEVTLSEVRICPLLKEVCMSLEPLAKQCDVTLVTSCKPISMTANTQQMKELFTNLITNAIKYNKPGGNVKVVVTTEPDEIVFVVEDTGVGISEESKQRIFERFYRVDKGRSKKMGGTGLGLSIVKHVVNYYNGKIQLESKLNVGSKFTVRFPKAKREPINFS